MHVRTKAVAVVAAAVLMAGCELVDWGGHVGSTQAFKEDFQQSHPLKPGGRLSVENFNGVIEVAGWDRDTVDISGTKYASTPEMRDAVKIDVAVLGNTVTVRTLKPTERRCNCGARYTIKVPRRTALDTVGTSNGSIRVEDVEGTSRLRTTNGTVRAARLRGSLDATTSNGGVEIEDLDGAAIVRTTNGRVRANGVRGAIEATTTNGGIQAQVVKSEASRPLRLGTTNGSIDLTLDSSATSDVHASTTNGGITLRLPVSLNARVRARTSNSSITTEFDVRSETAPTRHRLEGTIGSGGPTLDLSTSNGSIKLLKSSKVPVV